MIAFFAFPAAAVAHGLASVVAWAVAAAAGSTGIVCLLVAFVRTHKLTGRWIWPWSRIAEDHTMNKWRTKQVAFAVSHPVWAAILNGGAWGLLFWLLFGVTNQALNRLLFVISMSCGFLLAGPIFVVVLRRKIPRRPDSN
jgi:hypothetical protein